MVTYSDSQLRGALLEELILYMLRRSGYRTIEKALGDPNLNDGHSGLEVAGRGAWHQIDALAEFFFQTPFSNPQRLVIEAKCYKDAVGLGVIRNAVGVNKDISEAWATRGMGGKISRARFHYVPAVFSSSGFSKKAQDYAFAQDVYLLSLRDIPSVSPAITELDRMSLVEKEDRPALSSVRSYVRSRLRGEVVDMDDVEIAGSLEPFLNAALYAGVGLVVMLGKQFPIFLVAEDESAFRTLALNQANRIRIRKQHGQWFIANVNNIRLFSFDVPTELYRQYRDQDVSRRQANVDMKNDAFKEMYIFYEYEGEFRLVHMVLDEDWVQSLQREID